MQSVLAALASPMLPGSHLLIPASPHGRCRALLLLMWASLGWLLPTVALLPMGQAPWRGRARGRQGKQQQQGRQLGGRARGQQQRGRQLGERSARGQQQVAQQTPGLVKGEPAGSGRSLVLCAPSGLACSPPASRVTRCSPQQRMLTPGNPSQHPCTSTPRSGGPCAGGC